jgi:hypothetical protein
MVQTAPHMKALVFTAFLISLFCHAQDAVIPVDGGDATPEAMPTETDESAVAADTALSEEDGPAIPIPFDISRYDSTWDKNPFNLKTKPPEQTQVNWGQDWALASMSKYSGKIRISIRNKQTNEIKRIYNEPKEGDEFRLVEANFHRSRKEASAKIAKGTEEAELKYDENVAPVTVNNTMRPPSGAGAGGGQGVSPNGMINPPGTVGGNRPGIVNPTRPVTPAQSGRVFNAPNMQGGVSSGQPGFAGGNPQGGMINSGAAIQGGVVNPTLPVGAAGTPPTISRRRQLIPAPVVSPQSNP